MTKIKLNFISTILNIFVFENLPSKIYLVIFYDFFSFEAYDPPIKENRRKFVKTFWVRFNLRPQSPYTIIFENVFILF